MRKIRLCPCSAPRVFCVLKSDNRSKMNHRHYAFAGSLATSAKIAPLNAFCTRRNFARSADNLFFPSATATQLSDTQTAHRNKTLLSINQPAQRLSAFRNIVRSPGCRRLSIKTKRCHPNAAQLLGPCGRHEQVGLPFGRVLGHSCLRRRSHPRGR